MEAGRLSSGLPPGLGLFEPWYGLSDPRSAGRIDLGCLNRLVADSEVRLDDGRPVRFVEQQGPVAGGYESWIEQTAMVPTRCAGPGMVHDWLNALCWIRWPRIKATMNRLQARAAQARAGACDGKSDRGRLRDAITLFDESGALFVSADQAAIARWLAMDWHGLFVDGRERFGSEIAVLPVGHALLEKLLAPYKGVCAHALPVIRPAGGVAARSIEALDAAVASRLASLGLRTDELAPLPVLGIPGWCAANSDPGFYNDPLVFRTGRQRSRSS